jgi:dUTPase
MKHWIASILLRLAKWINSDKPTAIPIKIASEIKEDEEIYIPPENDTILKCDKQITNSDCITLKSCKMSKDTCIQEYKDGSTSTIKIISSTGIVDAEYYENPKEFYFDKPDKPKKRSDMEIFM